MAARAFSTLQPNQSGSDYIANRRNRANYQDVKEQAVTHNEKNTYNGDTLFNATNVTQTRSYDKLFSLSRGKHDCKTCLHDNSFHKKNAESQYSEVALGGSVIVVRELASPDVDNKLDTTTSNTFIDPDGVLFNSSKRNNPYLDFVNVTMKDASDNYVKFDFPQSITF
tara:strand:+ start:396 stop:899 length:504 start_codon:yes stop_codon:yes gene_type:complete